MNSADDFYKEEYKALRKQIEMDVEESRKLETYVVGSVAAVYAWFAKDGHANVSSAVLWLPLGMVILGVLRTLALFVHIGDVASYIKELEERFAGETQPGGWERRLANLKKSINQIPSDELLGVGSLAPHHLSCGSVQEQDFR